MAMAATRLAPTGKFQDRDVTADGQPRASVDLTRLETLWLNTGTLCNLECAGCYIESSPRNDRLSYLSLREAEAFFIEAVGADTRQIGITGGEPFMNPEIMAIIGSALGRGFEVLVLTNAMKPMALKQEELLALKEDYGERLVIRVSLDHYTQAGHEAERGVNSWGPTIQGLRWLSANGFALTIAGRSFTDEREEKMRGGYADVFDAEDIALDARDPVALTLFPEMDKAKDVAEITVDCWDILDVRPEGQMCATSRMVIKRKGAARPTVVSCTLLPYDEAFEMGKTLADSLGSVKLNHPYCAQFCVLGGASCSPVD